MGRGSLDFAKKLLDEKNAPPLSPGNDSSPEWCRCGVCRPMAGNLENLCCKRVNCITRFQVFNNICLDRDILEVCIKACCDIRADVPSCAVLSIRHTYPSQDGCYMGFRNSWTLEALVPASRERGRGAKGVMSQNILLKKTTLTPSPPHLLITISYNPRLIRPNLLL